MNPRIGNGCRYLALLACSVAFAPGDALADRFRMGVPTAPTHVWTIEANAFAANFGERTGGAHSIAVFPAGQLGNDAQMLQQLQTGALDMAFMPIAEITNRIPEFGALYAPYLAKDVAAAAELLASAEARGLLDQLPARIGVVGIGYSLAGMRQIISRSPVRSLDDLRGRKLRITPLDPIRDFYVQAGAAPIPLPLGSVYDALANGQIDAVDMDLENIWKQNYYDLAETVVLSNHMMFPMVGLVSAAKWRTLDPELKTTITELMTQHFERIAVTYIEAETEYQAELAAAGIEIQQVGPEFFGPVLDRWEQTWRQKAPVLARLRQLAAAAEAGSAEAGR
ncbi:MAG TPA: TRAP transporter substrate-binding protein [Gammaproteobacteria bacterium]|nr:TRAP transporter substrate-binding protein [Gammaproteobacteria bacterium]